MKKLLLITAAILGLLASISSTVLFGPLKTVATVIILLILVVGALITGGIWRELRNRKKEKAEEPTPPDGKGKPKPGTLTWGGVLKVLMTIFMFMMVVGIIVNQHDEIQRLENKAEVNLQVSEKITWRLTWELGPGEYEFGSGKNGDEFPVQMIILNDKEIRFIVERTVYGEKRHTVYTAEVGRHKAMSYGGRWTQTEDGGESGDFYLNRKGKFSFSGAITSPDGSRTIPCKLEAK